MTLSITIVLVLLAILFLKYQDMKFLHAITLFVLGLFSANTFVGIKTMEFVNMLITFVQGWFH